MDRHISLILKTLLSVEFFHSYFPERMKILVWNNLLTLLSKTNEIRQEVYFAIISGFLSHIPFKAVLV